MIKKFCATIYLEKDKAVRNRLDRTILEESPEELSHRYSDMCADEIIVFDLSNTDDEHEAAIGAIKRIVAAAEVPVIGCGNIKRFEDVKKILYAGCSAAALNFAKDSNIDLAEDVAKRFGKEKIYACVGSISEISGKKSILNEFIGGLILIGGADDHYSSNALNEITQAVSLPLTIPMPDAAPGQIAGLLKREGIAGVFGPIVNANIDELNAI